MTGFSCIDPQGEGLPMRVAGENDFPLGYCGTQGVLPNAGKKQVYTV